MLAPVAHSGWWIARGWRVLAEIGGAVRLEPPGLRPPDVIGASVALIHAPTDRVLLGRRLSPPAKGDWAFPGGRTEPGEAPIDTALRELQEETGIALKPRTDPHLRTTVFAADDQGTTVFRIVNPLWLIDEAPEPKPTETLDSRWLSLSDVDAMRPVVAGVRRVLRRWRSPREAIAARPD